MPGVHPRPMSKVCDAADFFAPEYVAAVKNELNAVPTLHRKQWEFAMIYLALKKRGMLDPGKAGLSMGSGNEVVLYAIARQVRHLTATDLYSSESMWDCAKAANPDEYIRKSKPFPVDDAGLDHERSKKASKIWTGESPFIDASGILPDGRWGASVPSAPGRESRG